MPLTTMVTGTPAKASDANANWSLCVLTDTAKTISVTHVWAATQQFTTLTASRPVYTDASQNLVSATVTGTGSVVQSVSPTITGTLVLAAATASGLISGSAGLTISAGTSALQAITGTTLVLSSTAQISGALTYGGVTLSNAVTGTGNMVLSASPTLTGTLTAAIANFSGAVATTTLTASSAVRTVSTGTAFVDIDGTTSASSRLYRSGTLKWEIGRGIVSGPNDDWIVYDRVSGTPVLTITSGTSAVAFAGALSGITTLAMGGALSGVTTIAVSSTSTFGGGMAMLTGANIGFQNAANNTNATIGNTGATGVNTLTVTATNIVLSGAVSGITTLAGTGAISGFTSANFSGGVNFTKGTGSVLNGAAVHITKGTGAGLYLLTALPTGAGSAFSYLLTDDGATTSVVALATNVNWTVAAGVSTDLATITNGSGGTQTLTYSVTRLYS